MGEQGYYPLHGIRARKCVLVPMSFSPNGSSTITVTSKQKQRGLKSVTRGGTGAFTLIMNDRFPSAALVGVMCAVRSPSGQYTAQIVGVPDLDASGGASIPITVFQAGSAADINADPDAEVFVTLLLAKTQLEAER